MCVNLIGSVSKRMYEFREHTMRSCVNPSTEFQYTISSVAINVVS